MCAMARRSFPTQGMMALEDGSSRSLDNEDGWQYLRYATINEGDESARKSTGNNCIMQLSE